MSNNNIFEDLPSRKDIPAAAPRPSRPSGQQSDRRDGPDSEDKRIRQAVYDIRYRARREEIPLAQAYSQYMQNASLSGAEKIAVRKKLFEEYEISNMISDGIATAMFKVFVEGTQETDEEYLEELKRGYIKREIERVDREAGVKKYKIRVTDKNTNRSYVRYATREKINQLRANPNIKEVEMTEYGDPYEGERKQGKQTASVAAGKGLDPVGKEDSDVNNDGKVNKTDDYILNRRNKIGQAIKKARMEAFGESSHLETDMKKRREANEKAVEDMKKTKAHKDMVATVRKKFDETLDPVGQEDDDIDNDGKKNTKTDKYLKHRRDVRSAAITKEEFFDEKMKVDNKNERKITGKGVNNKKLITVYPTLGSQVQEETIEEKAVSTAQQKFFGMVHAYKTGKMKGASPEVKKAAKSISDTEAEKFASTKHKGLPGHVKKESIELDETGMPAIVIRKKESEKSDPNMTSDLKKINPDDKRGNFAKDAKVKNTLHSMGVKSVIMVGEENEENLDELNRFARETGRSFRTGRPTSSGGTMGGSDANSQALRSVMRSMGSGRAGVQPRGVKKEKGKKPPEAGQPGSGVSSPAQKVKRRREDAQRAQDMMHSRFD